MGPRVLAVKPKGFEWACLKSGAFQELALELRDPDWCELPQPQVRGLCCQR